MRKPNLGILIKPASYDCNMACDYCYYRSVKRLYPDVKRPRMSPEVFNAVCEQYRALQPGEIKIGWQGGEPTLMGLDFFREAIRIETRHARSGDCWGNSLQTNGLVLDEEWARFLAANHFLVGISVDGPPELNAVRKLRDGRPAYEAAMQSVQLLKDHEVEYNILVVVSRANVEHPVEVFEFLKENDFHFSQFIPCTEPSEGQEQLSPHSINAGEYADFMIALFDAWVANEDPSYYVRRIDNWLHQFFGLPPECCEYREDCSNLITIEWNGDVYPCDFYVTERYRMGNVLEQTLEQMLNGEAFREFVSRAEQIPAVCADCEWLKYCHGGCFRHREKLGIDGDEVPYLCEAKQRIFKHVFTTLEEIKEDASSTPMLNEFLNRIGRQVDEEGATESAAREPSPPSGAPRPPVRGAVGRNDPCPCGSGKKFKHCCGRTANTRARR